MERKHCYVFEFKSNWVARSGFRNKEYEGQITKSNVPKKRGAAVIGEEGLITNRFPNGLIRERGEG